MADYNKKHYLAQLSIFEKVGITRISFTVKELLFSPLIATVEPWKSPSVPSDNRMAVVGLLVANYA